MKALQFSIILAATILLDSCGCGICAFERTDWPLAITFVKNQDTIYSFFNPDYLGQGIHFPKVYQDSIDNLLSKNYKIISRRNLVKTGNKCDDINSVYAEVKQYIIVRDDCK